MKVEKAMFITFVCLFLGFVVYIKILGATEIGIDVEKKGYCKLNLGEDWYYKEGNLCNPLGDLEPIEFTKEEFRDYCPDHKFISKSFYSKCFHAGRNY